MAPTSFHLKIFTPAGQLQTAEVRSALVPVSDGEIGVFPQHARYHGVLGTGVLSIEPLSGPTQRLVVSDGFCSFADDTLTILADEAFATTVIDLNAYASNRPAFSTTLATAPTESIEWVAARRKLLIIEAVDSLVKQ